MPDRVCVRKEFSCESLVHHRNVAVTLAVVDGQHAPANELNSERFEIAVTHCLQVNIPHCIGGRVHPDSTTPPATHRHPVGECYRLHAWQ